MTVLSPKTVYAPGREPLKAEVIQLLEQMQDNVGASVSRSTLSDLQAVTPAAGTFPRGEVKDDPDPTNNGWYSWDSDNTQWVFDRSFPDTLASVALSGPANAQLGTLGAGVDPADVVEFRAVVVTENTGPMTLQHEGEAARPVVNAAGNALSGGEWTGTVKYFIDDDGNFRLSNDPGSAQASAESATLAGQEADRAEDALAATQAAMSSVVQVEFATKATAQAYAPAVAPDFIRLAGRASAGDTGGALYQKVASEPAHDGKFSITLSDAVTVVWYEYADAVVNAFALIDDAADGTDITPALHRARDIIIARGGGKIDVPLKGLATTLVCETACSLLFPGLTVEIDWHNNVITAGDSFKLDGVNEFDHFLTIGGDDPTDISGTVTQLFGTYAMTNAAFSGERGTRLYMASDNPADLWDVGDNNYRPSMRNWANFPDNANNILNFERKINFRMDILGATDRELDPTYFKLYACLGDARVTMRNVLFIGDFSPIGVDPDPSEGGYEAGGTRTKGIKLTGGRFTLDNVNASGLYTAITAWYAEVTWRDSYCHATWNGYGAKLVLGTHMVGINLQILGSRHAIGVAGTGSFAGASFVGIGCEFGEERDAFNPDLYPGETFGAFDHHGNAWESVLIGCTVYGHISTANGKITCTGGTKIWKSQTKGAVLFTATGGDRGEVFIDDSCEIIVPRYIRPVDEGGGAGSFSSDAYLFKHQTDIGPVDWVLRCAAKVTCEDGTTWPADSILRLEPGNMVFKEVDFSRMRFELRGTNFGRITLSGKSAGGILKMLNAYVDGAGVSALEESTLDDFGHVDVSQNEVYNDDPVASYGWAIRILGDTGATSVTKSIRAVGNKGRTIGTQGIVETSAVALEKVAVDDNDFDFVATSGALTKCYRTHRNQAGGATDVSNFVASAFNNKARNVAGVNTITDGVQLLGLDAVGGTALSGGFYRTGQNIIEGATGTKLSTTGTAIVTV